MTTPPALEASGRPDTAALEVIQARAPRYELPALLRALACAGLPLSSLRFDSRRAPDPATESPADSVKLSPQPNLVERLELDWAEDPPTATLYLNWGFFGPRSPLPSYFQRLLQAGHAESLARLLHVIDDGLLRTRGVACEAARSYFSEGLFDARLAESLVTASPVYVDWLFRHVFPELRVEVRRGGLERAVRVDRVALGAAMLGSSALNGTTAFSQQALDVCLTTTRDLADSALARSEDFAAGGAATSPWIREAKYRLDRHVLPRFRWRPLSLRVRLRVLASRVQARLLAARVDESMVVQADPPRLFTLYSGHLGTAER